MKGTVKWFNNKKGYGFITKENGHDIFVHYSGIWSDEKFKTLNKDDKVIFDIEPYGDKQIKAVNVKVIKKSSDEPVCPHCNQSNYKKLYSTTPLLVSVCNNEINKITIYCQCLNCNEDFTWEK